MFCDDCIADGDGEIDLATAVDVAIRDLREIMTCWGSEIARQCAEECELVWLSLARSYKETERIKLSYTNRKAA
jgi:hypothetical protein